MNGDEVIRLLPHVNASLNLLATGLLIAGYVLIKRQQEHGHRAAMLAAFITSIVFLGSYLTYHASTEAVRRFPSYPPDAVRYFYYLVLLSHVVLAALVPLVATITIYLGWRQNRIAHARLAQWTLPLWLYVSVTGVLVYLMLYQLWPPQG